MNSSSLKPQQLHPCTVCTSDGDRWLLSCFAHDLTCWVHQVKFTMTNRTNLEHVEVNIEAFPCRT